jgi:hypothetical protein
MRRGFTFKSKLIDGRICHYSVIVEDSEEALMIVKNILSKEDITHLGFKLIKETKWGDVYQQVMSLKFNSLVSITAGVFQPLNGGYGVI